MNILAVVFVVIVPSLLLMLSLHMIPFVCGCDVAQSHRGIRPFSFSKGAAPERLLYVVHVYRTFTCMHGHAHGSPRLQTQSPCTFGLQFSVLALGRSKIKFGESRIDV